MSKAVKALLIVLVIAGIALVTGLFLKQEKQVIVEMPVQSLKWDLNGFSEVDVKINENKILLINECKQLRLVTTREQAEAVENGMRGEIDERPVALDLFADSLNFFDVRVLMVRVTDFKEDSYRADLILREEDRILEIDSRPSDAIAVAVRAEAPVYVSDSLLINRGERIC